MYHFQIEQTATAVILWEGEHASAKEAIAALEDAMGSPDDGWEDSVVIHKKWIDVNGDKNRETMTVNEALES